MPTSTAPTPLEDVLSCCRACHTAKDLRARTLPDLASSHTPPRSTVVAPRAPTSRLRLVALLHCSASLDCLFRRSLDGNEPGQRGIDLLDRPALYFDSPDQEGEPGNHAPGRKVVHRRFDARKCSFWSDDVARADDQRQAEWTDDLAEIAEPALRGCLARPIAPEVGT